MELFLKTTDLLFEYIILYYWLFYSRWILHFMFLVKLSRHFWVFFDERSVVQSFLILVEYIRFTKWEFLDLTFCRFVSFVWYKILRLWKFWIFFKNVIFIWICTASSKESIHSNKSLSGCHVKWHSDGLGRKPEDIFSKKGDCFIKLLAIIRVNKLFFQKKYFKISRHKELDDLKTLFQQVTSIWLRNIADFA